MEKSYYAIIPANVRYDKELTQGAKLLYGEITALCNEKGYCWAGDNYFSELYGNSKRTIQRWIGQLEKKGYIAREVKYGENNKIEQRRIYIQDPMTKMSYPLRQKCHTPYDKNVRVNNTSNNTKEYNAFFEKMWKLYPSKKGKGQVSKSKKKEIYKLGDEFKRCISRYKDYVTSERAKGFKELKYQNGSTFFNNGYIDYLDENYKEIEMEREVESANWRGSDKRL